MSAKQITKLTDRRVHIELKLRAAFIELKFKFTMISSHSVLLMLFTEQLVRELFQQFTVLNESTTASYVMLLSNEELDAF